MAEKPYDWFRFYSEAPDDPKFGIIARETGVDENIAFAGWAKILCRANSSPVRGSLYVTSQRQLCDADISFSLKIDIETCIKLLQAYIQMEMLDIDERGAYRVKNWEKRQFASDTSRKRTREYRNRNSVTSQERHSDGIVTPPESESDTETDINNIPSIETEMLEMWRVLFPKKPQPRPGTYRDKIKARWSSSHFQENWQAALEKASLSRTLQEDSWFCFEFFVKNDKNYQKMLDGWMDWKDKEAVHSNGGNGNGKAQASRKSKQETANDAFAEWEIAHGRGS